jgi:hypothetical protein
MLIEEGDRYRGVARADLPEVPPPEIAVPDVSSTPGALTDDGTFVLGMVGLLLGVGLVLLLVARARKKRSQ